MPDLALAILSNVNKVDMENNKQQHIEDGENIEDAELWGRRLLHKNKNASRTGASHMQYLLLGPEQTLCNSGNSSIFGNFDDFDDFCNFGNSGNFDDFDVPT